MLHHIMLGTKDVDRPKAFYDAVLAVVGAPDGVRHVARSGLARVLPPSLREDPAVQLF